MKIFNLVIALLMLTLCVFGQSSYYWYKGKKIPLTEIGSKKFILLEDDAPESILDKTEETFWKVKSQGIDNTIASLIPFNNTNIYKPIRWEIIDNIDNKALLPAKLKEQKFYSTPFFRTQKGEEIGLSHLFYVKLIKESDIETLIRMSNENYVEIIGKNKYMPLWITLACTKHSKGNALEMANLFFESGKYSAAEPDLMVDDILQCVNDTYFNNQWNLNNNGPPLPRDCIAWFPRITTKYFAPTQIYAQQHEHLTQPFCKLAHLLFRLPFQQKSEKPNLMQELCFLPNNV